MEPQRVESRAEEHTVDWGRALLAGLIATALITVTMGLGGQNIMKMLGGMLMPDASTGVQYAIGGAIHLAVGLFYGVLYAWLLGPVRRRGRALKGALYGAALTGIALAVMPAAGAMMGGGAGNPCGGGAAKNPCNPCAGSQAGNPCKPDSASSAGNPCNPCNPCHPSAGGAAANPCNPCNPCHPSDSGSAGNPCNPCNPCAPPAAGSSAANPCQPVEGAANPCHPEHGAANPCGPAANNPCAGAGNPCGGAAANPCGANPCSAAGNPCGGAANPCGGGGGPMAGLLSLLNHVAYALALAFVYGSRS